MEQNILQLYQIILNQEQFNPELIQNASNNLSQLYSNPDALFSLFNLYGQQLSPNFKLIILTGMKCILSLDNVWAHYAQTDQTENIKSAFIHILQNEQQQLLFENAVAAASLVAKVEYSTWPEYILLLQQFSTQNKFLFSLYMINSFVPFSDPEFLSNIWDFLTNIAIQGLLAPDQSIIYQSSILASNLFQYVSDLNANLPQLFSALLQVFVQQIQMNSPISGRMIDHFEKIAENDDFDLPNSVEIARQFLNLIMSDPVCIDLKCLLYTPLILFLSKSEECEEKDDTVSSLFESIFIVSSSSLIDEECLENQENMQICQSNFEGMIDSFKAEHIHHMIFEKSTGSNSKGEIMTHGLFLSSFAEKCPELMIHDISKCISFGFACISTDDHSLQETGFELMSTLFSRQNDAFFGIQDQYFASVFKAFSSQHPPLVLKALESVFFFLESTTIKKELVNNLFASIFQVMKECGIPVIQSKAIDCFANLIRSLAEDVIPFVPNIMPIVVQAATEMNNPEQAEVKGSAVECLGTIIQYCKEIPDLEHILHVFIDCVQSGDSLLISSGFRSLANAVSSQIPQVVEVLPIGLNTAYSIIQSEPTFVDDEEGENQNNIMIDLWTYTMDFISKVAKKFPDSIRENLNNIQNTLYNLFDDNEDISCSAIKTSAVLIKLFPPDAIIAYLNKIYITLDEATSTRIASLCFHILGKFIRKQAIYQISIPGEIIIQACQQGLLGISRNLSFQDEWKELEFDVNFGFHLYCFFEDVARFSPALFPLNDFWNSCSPILKEGNPFEQSYVISVLKVVYTSLHQTMGNIQKKVIIREFVEKLPICDCYEPPYAIAAVRTVVETEPKQVEKYIPQIMEFLDQLLQTEYEDQLSYYTTMDHAVSLLFSLFKMCFKENFPIDKYMPLMLTLLPSTTDAVEAEITYTNLVFLCFEYPAVMSRFSPEIIRILAQTFALKEKEWDTISLPVDILQSMAILLRNLLVSMKQGNEILAASVVDEIAKERFHKRFNSFLIT